MFRELINQPIDPIPVEYINTLSRLENEPDYSLTCLGIAMLKHRVENYRGITGVYKNYDDETMCVADAFTRLERCNDVPTFCYYTYSQVDDDSDIKAKIKEKGLEIKEPIGALIKQKADVKCVAVFHPEKNFGAIFINSRDNRYYHLLISFLSLLLPNLFKDKELTDMDYNLIKALSKNDKNAFVQRVQESVKPYIMEFRRIMLGVLIKAMHEVKIDSALSDVNSYRTHIEEARKRLSELTVSLRTAIVQYEGLKATEYMDKPEEDLVDYLSTNPMVHNLHVDGNTLSFCVATLLNNYNVDSWNTFAHRGFIFDGDYNRDLLEAFKSEDNRKLLLNSIFNESPEFAVKMAGNYNLNIYDNRLTCSRHFDYQQQDPIFKDYVANPHIELFACLGGYEDRVEEALEERNFVGAIELCCASAGSVNLDETTQVFRPFLGWIMNSRNKILHRRDGVDMTPEEALVYLAEKEKEAK